MPLTYRSLLDIIDSTHDRKAVRLALSAFARDLGLTHAAYLNLQGNWLTYLGDYPREWEELYLSRGFITVDPVITEARRRSGAFFWSATDWIKQPNPTVRTFARDAIAHGLAHGLTISAKASFDQQLLLSFAGTNTNLSHCLKSDMQDAVPLLMGLHYGLQRQLDLTPIQAFAALSPRELLCLTWAAKGKTTTETGIIMNLSTRTVQHYLDAARHKLGANSVSHLVAISKDIRLI